MVPMAPLDTVTPLVSSETNSINTNHLLIFTQGPHDSHMANKLDPRVDSDRYGTAGNTAGAGGVGAGQYGSSTGTHGTTGGIGSTTAGTYDDGTLPKALTEDVSRAEPHSSVHGHQHGAGTTVHGKPKLTDKLNPKKDADGDGKAGFMD